MKDLFDSRRFGKYFAYEIRSGWRQYTTYIGAVLIMLAFIMIFIGFTNGAYYEGGYHYSRSNSYGYDPMWGVEMGWFWFSIFAVCIIAASRTFSDLSGKDGRIFSLMLPASQFEKYLTRWLILGPVTLVLFICGCELVDLQRCLVLSIAYPDSGNIHALGAQLFDFTSTEWKSLIAAILFLQSVNVLGSSIWPKNAVVKTLFAIAVIVLLNAMFGGFLVRLMYEEGMYYADGTIFDKSEMDIADTMLCLSVIMSLVNYVVAYFRIREIEIVQRW